MSQTIKALLVDDEQDSREVLRSLLETHFPVVTIVGEATSAEDAYHLIGRHHPQLVFLDIQMPRASGFSLLKKFETVPFEVVFVTSFDQYAINAIKFSALDYLLKPVELPDLEMAVNKAIQRKQDELVNGNLRIINLLHNLEPDIKDRQLAVHAGEKVMILNTRDILYIEGEGRYCNVFMQNNEHYITAKYLKDFEDYLGETSSFIRISKSYLINTLHIRDYTKGELCIIRMTNKMTFEVARRKKQEILERLRMK